MEFKRPESVLVVIYDQQHRVLVLQRKDDPNFWQSVTGSLEGDETPAQTAIREVAEETGIQLEPAQLTDCQRTNHYTIRTLWRHRYAPGVTENTEYVFTANVAGDEPILLTEHTAFEWLEKDAAIERVWSPSNKDAIVEFLA